MSDNIHKYNAQTLEEAAEIIKKGGLVAFPTETVYGLGANVYNPQAVANIFAAKGRPSFNPLISHIADLDFLPEYAQIDSRVTDLARRFWPGPLTFVLRRKDNNPALDLACAGLPTVTVRMPDHKIALELIKTSGVPIVAPSANRSTTVSPTTAQHVADSLGNKVDMILDGGACRVGVESTIIDLTTDNIVLLRAGGISLEDLEAFTGEKILISHGNPDQPNSPGQLLKHYAPAMPLRTNVAATDVLENEFFIGFGHNAANAQLNLSPDGNLQEAAANLFSFLREAETHTEYSGIAMSPIPETGLGLAINDRIRRASYK